MKTLRDYTVVGGLLQNETGPEAQTGDQVRLFLDQDANPGFPEFVVGVIQHPITAVNCGEAKSYVITYDEADLDGAAALLRPQDVVDAQVISATDFLQTGLTEEIAERIQADETLAESIEAEFKTSSFSSSATGVTLITLPVGCKHLTVYGAVTGAAGTRTIALDLTNAVAGSVVDVVVELPATENIILDFRNATQAGTQLDTITTDNSGDNARFRFNFTTVWNKVSTEYPN